jgi:CheY-like chemotaxis protein
MPLNEAARKYQLTSADVQEINNMAWAAGKASSAQELAAKVTKDKLPAAYHGLWDKYHGKQKQAMVDRFGLVRIISQYAPEKISAAFQMVGMAPLRMAGGSLKDGLEACDEKELMGILEALRKLDAPAEEEAMPQQATLVASVFVFEDDPERISLFKKAFGERNVVTAASVGKALSILREGGFSRIYLDRDVSNPNENGEDLAWQMEREALCKNVPIVIHSENARGQKVMARYIGRYHPNVSVTPFRQLKRQLDIPGARA